MSIPVNCEPYVATLCVGDLINPYVKTWNARLIYSLFDQATSTKILNTPLF